jgi:hypothetical protein
LIWTPSYGGLLREETMRTVKGQLFDGEAHHVVHFEQPHKAPDNRNVLYQFQMARERALKRGYDALLTVEHDMWLPVMALKMLWATGAPVAYGVYVLRHGASVLNAWEYVPGSRNLGESLSIHPRKLAKAQKQGVVPVSGVGFGCTLIRREALEAIPFRSGEKGSEAPDVPFATDCLRAGLGQVAHFGVVCGHYDPAADRWLWPFAEVGSVTCVALQDVTTKSGKLVAGQRCELPVDEAKELSRAGYIRLI